MSEVDDKKKKRDEEFESILDIIAPRVKNKFESELAHIFEDMEKDDDLGAAVDKLIDECTELTELQSKLILLIQEHLKKRKKELDPKKAEGVDADEEKIARDAEELCRKLLMEVDEELDPTYSGLKNQDKIL